LRFDVIDYSLLTIHFFHHSPFTTMAERVLQDSTTRVPLVHFKAL